MGRLRDAINRLLDRIDPPKQPVVLAPCPSCKGDVSARNIKSEVKNGLVFFRCVCGHGSAWNWNGHGPQLVYGQEPGVDPETYEDLD